MRTALSFLLIAGVLLAAGICHAQAQQPAPPAAQTAGATSATEPQRPPVLSPHARLLAARSIVIQHSGGIIPNDIIGEAFAGWGRFTIVYEREQADLIVSIEAPTVEGGVSVSGGSGQSSASRTLSSGAVTQIRLTIRDARNGLALWNGVETPHSALKGKRREDNEVDASLKLFRRFRALIEPEPVQ